jgi:hypothetical protein
MAQIFKLTDVRRKRGKRRMPEFSSDDLYKIDPFERPLPFYSVIPSLASKDPRLGQLTFHEKGAYRLLCDAIWHGCGTLRRSDLASWAEHLGIPANELADFVEKIISVGLLVERGSRLIQLELREQYVATSRANSAKGDSRQQNKSDDGHGDYDEDDLSRPF